MPLHLSAHRDGDCNHAAKGRRLDLGERPEIRVGEKRRHAVQRKRMRPEMTPRTTRADTRTRLDQPSCRCSARLPGSASVFCMMIRASQLGMAMPLISIQIGVFSGAVKPRSAHCATADTIESSKRQGQPREEALVGKRGRARPSRSHVHRSDTPTNVW